MTGEQIEKFFKDLGDESITLFGEGESLAASTLSYIESLKAKNAALVAQLESSCCSRAALERIKQENKDLRLLMFAFVRNSAVLPVGLSLGKSEQEITDKTFETIAEARKMLDGDKMRAAMNIATKKENRYDEE